MQYGNSKADRDALTHILKQATTKPKVLVIRSDQLMVAGSGIYGK